MRIEEFDVLKGMAISVVVFIHATFFNFTKLPPSLQATMMSIATFLAPAIAIFFFISGFLGYKSYAKRKSFMNFEKLKLKLVVPPYLAWSTVYLILQIFLGKFVGIPYHLELIIIVKQYLLGEVFLPFYYIILLVLFYMLTPWLSKFETKTLKRLLLWLFIMGIFSVGMYFIPQYFGKEYISSLATYRNPFVWLPFYVWGIYTAKVGKLFWRNRPSTWTVIFFFSIYIFSIIEVISVPKLNVDFESYFMLGPIVYVFYFFAIRLFLWASYKMFEKRKKVSKIFSALGRNSFGIYLTHGVVLYGLLGSVLLLDKNILQVPNFLVMVVAGIVGIGLCYGFSEILLRLPRTIRNILI